MMTTTNKGFDLVGAIMDFEAGEQDEESTLRLFAHLVKTGLAWTLQGMYGRVAKHLIESGLIDSEGNVL